MLRRASAWLRLGGLAFVSSVLLSCQILLDFGANERVVREPSDAESGGDAATNDDDGATASTSDGAAADGAQPRDGGGDGFVPPPCGDCPRTVFMTSNQWSGDLGGLVGADQKCQDAAHAGGLDSGGRTFKAWLSDATIDAKTRMFAGTGPYRLPLGDAAAPTVVADNFDAFSKTSAQPLKSAIDRDEYGVLYTGTHKVWSSTASDGTRLTQNDCFNWTFGNFGESGTWGDTSQVGPKWTDTTMTTHCDNANHLYCFEQ